MLTGKLKSIWNRIIYIFLMLPIRFKRLFIHLALPFGFFKNNIQALIIESPLDWQVGVILYVLDIFGVPELYEILFEIGKWNLRDLNLEERKLVNTLFAKTVKTDMIRLDEKAVLGPKQYHFAYVSFHTINSYGRLNKPIFVHEIVHVWQYHKLGSIYTYKALRAQNSDVGYSYGGFKSLYFAFERRKALLTFNFEQQAEIIMHAFQYHGKVAKKIIQRDLIKESVYNFYLDQVMYDNGYQAAIDGLNKNYRPTT